MLGPRIDRPSAIGEEGRPRATSLTIVAILGLAILGTVGVLAGIGAFISLSGFAVVFLTSGMALLQRDTYRSLLGGHLFLHTGSTVMLTLLLVAGLTGQLIIAVGLLAAMFGIATTWTNTLDEETFRDAASYGSRSYVYLLVLSIVAAIIIGMGAAGYLVVQAVIETSNLAGSMLGFSITLAAAGLLVFGAMRQIPIDTITDGPDGTAVGEYLLRTRSYAKYASLAGGVLFGLTILLIFSNAIATLQVTFPPLQLLFALLTSIAVIGPLALVGGVAALVWALASQVPTIADAIDTGEYESVAAWSASLVMLGMVLLLTIIPVGGSFAILGPFSVFIGPPFALIFVLYLPVAATGGFMSRQASGPAVSAAGLVLLGVGVNGAGAPAPLFFACIAGAIIVWDLATFGTSLTIELGHIPETRRLELYHGLVSVGVGATIVLTLTGVNFVRRQFVPSDAALTGVALVVAGIVTLLAFDWRG